MPFIERILFPVDFSPACVATAAYVKRAASLLRAKVTLLHVVDLTRFDAMQQAVRIPREFELPGEDAIMRKEGKQLVIEPTVPKSLLALLEVLGPLDEEFPPISDPLPEPFDL